MTEIDHVILPAFRYFAGESEKICRLCFGDTDNNGVLLNESRLIQCQYFDDTVTYEDMLKDLGAAVEPSLPKMLCEHCADIAINSFLFLKLCHESYKKWQENLEKFNKTLDLSEDLDPEVKTAYLFIQNESNHILTIQKKQKEKTKEVALKKIQHLLRQRKTFNVKKKAGVICEQCGKKFRSHSYLTTHMIVHLNKKYSCPECLKVFSSLPHLQDHSERIHRPKTIQCTKCAEMFSTERMLKRHDTNHHTAAVCKLCFKQFPSKNILRQHLDKHDIHKCPRCFKDFISKCSFRVHLKFCGTEQAKQLKFFCDICGNGYTFRNGLLGHMKATHGFGRAYSCNWCNKPFDAASKLKSHIVKHTRERNFHCEQCGGQFVTQAALVYHIRRHTGEKPFSCDLCDESFLSASRRMEHKRRKHLGPNQECNICHSKFITSHELKKHIVRHQNPQSKLFVEN